jgi:excisionase family DNA binding protein
VKVLTVKQAARLLQLHPSTVYRMVKRGEIPAAKIGRVWRFSTEALHDWIRGGAKGEVDVRKRKRRVGKRGDPILRVMGTLAIGTLTKEIDSTLYGRTSG